MESQACPVCLGRIPVEHFSTHMASHSKDEDLAALLRQTPMGQPPTATPIPTPNPISTPIPSTSASSLEKHGNISGLHFLAATAAREMAAPTNVIMPQMMGMVMPVLVPQQNGPPIILNLPTYAYPNVLNSANSPHLNPEEHKTVPISQPVKIEVPPEQPQVPHVVTPRSPVAILPGPSREINEIPEKTDISDPLKNENSDQKICTVETVNDLMNAQMLLKSNEDVQIVVSNDLLETNEFKTFMSHLNLPPQTQNETKIPNQVPNNTPMTTRPPSTVPVKYDIEDSEDSENELETNEQNGRNLSSPQPSTSRVNSNDSSPKITGNTDSDEDCDDDDICLQVRFNQARESGARTPL